MAYSMFTSGRQLLSARSRDQILSLAGEKLQETGESPLEDQELDARLKDHQSLLQEPKVARRDQVSKGLWLPESRMVQLGHHTGKFWHYMGAETDIGKCLYPEEALYLIDIGELEVEAGGIILSMQQAQVLLLQDGNQLDQYLVYAHLSRTGCKVVRHQPHLIFTRYEKQLRLDQHQTKTKKRLKLSNQGDGYSVNDNEESGTACKEQDETLKELYASLGEAAVNPLMKVQDQCDKQAEELEDSFIKKEATNPTITQYEETRRKLYEKFPSMYKKDVMNIDVESSELLPEGCKPKKEKYNVSLMALWYYSIYEDGRPDDDSVLQDTGTYERKRHRPHYSKLFVNEGPNVSNWRDHPNIEDTRCRGKRRGGGLRHTNKWRRYGYADTVSNWREAFPDDDRRERGPVQYDNDNWKNYQCTQFLDNREEGHFQLDNWRHDQHIPLDDTRHRQHIQDGRGGKLKYQDDYPWKGQSTQTSDHWRDQHIQFNDLRMGDTEERIEQYQTGKDWEINKEISSGPDMENNGLRTKKCIPEAESGITQPFRKENYKHEDDVQQKTPNNINHEKQKPNQDETVDFSSRPEWKRKWHKKQRQQGRDHYPCALLRVGKDIKCWKDYKQFVEEKSWVKMLNRGPASALWMGPTTPLFKPSPGISTQSALKMCNLESEMKDWYVYRARVEEDLHLSIVYDAYLPVTPYKKSSPATPDKRIVIMRNGSVPSPGQLLELTTRYQDNVAVVCALVIGGEVRFYTFTSLSLPAPLTS